MTQSLAEHRGRTERKVFVSETSTFHAVQSAAWSSVPSENRRGDVSAGRTRYEAVLTDSPASSTDDSKIFQSTVRTTDAIGKTSTSEDLCLQT